MRKICIFACALPVLALLAGGLAYGSAGAHYVRVGDSAKSAASYGPSRSINWGKPVFATTFNGTRLNKHRWSKYDDPEGKFSGWRRTKASVKVRHGSLEIIGHYQRPYGYVGGGVSYNFNRTYGRWVVRFRADRGAGYEPVVLLWPKGTWPDDGEIDMAEIWNAQRDGAGEFLHLGKDNRVAAHPIPRSVHFSRWQILAVDWLPSHITFWLDGKKLWRVNRKSDNKNFIPSTPFHLAMQNDESCANHECKPDKSTPKQTIMQIGWVKIYAAPAGAK